MSESLPEDPSAEPPRRIWDYPQYLDAFEDIVGPAFTDPVLTELLESAKTAGNRDEQRETMSLLPEEELDLRNTVYVGFLRILVEDRRKIRKAPRGKQSYRRTEAENLALNGRFEDSLTPSQLQVIRIKRVTTVNTLANDLEQINSETPTYSYDNEESAETAEQDASNTDEGEDLYDLIFGGSNAALNEVVGVEEDTPEDVPPEDSFEEAPEETPVPELIEESVPAQDDLVPTFLKGVGPDRALEIESQQESDAGEEPATDTPLIEGLFEHQIPYVLDIKEFLHEPAQKIYLEEGDEGNKRYYYVKGALVEASTGMGKTLMLAKAAIAADIGKLNELGKRRDMLIVVPNRYTARQLAGEIGDDTFRRFGPPGIRVAVVDSSNPHLDHEAEVTVTTIDQYVMHTRGGMFKGKFFGLLGIDEVHTLTQPQFQRTFLEQWHIPGSKQRPIPTIGFTATSQYSDAKDAKRLLPRLIKHGETVEYMDKGILSAGQFYTIIADPEYAVLGPVQEGSLVAQEALSEIRNRAILHTTAEITKPLLAEGRRGIVFCDAGDQAANAIELARVFTELGYPAEALHSIGDPNRAARLIADYHAGKLKVLTSVNLGVQSLNADFNFVGVAGNVNSLLKLRQIVGRGIGSGARMSEEYPVTTFFHVVAGHMGRYARTVTFADALDVDELEQGAIIGNNAAGNTTTKTRASKTGQSLVTPEAFPEEIRLSIQRVRTYTSQKIRYELNGTMPDEPIPDDYIPFDEIYSPIEGKIDAAAAKRRLDYAGYAWVGELVSEEDRTRLLRHYEPGAKTFFSDNPVAPRVADGWKNTSQTAKHLGVSDAYVTSNLSPRMQEETGLTGEPRLNDRGRTFTYYSPESIEWMEEAIKDIPTKDAEDATQKAICDNLGIDASSFQRYKEKAQVEPVYKRLENGKGFRWVYSPEDQEKLSAAADIKPMATDEYWGVVRIAKEAGVTTAFAHKLLTSDDKEAMIPLRAKVKLGANTQVRELDHLKEDRAREVVARIKAHVAANNHPWATDEDWSLVRIAKEAGTDSEAVRAFLTPDEKDALYSRRASTGGKRSKVIDHVKKELGKQIVQRIKTDGDGVPAHAIPYSTVTRITNAPAKQIPISAKPQSEMLRMPRKKPIRIVHWPGVAKLGEKYGTQEAHPDIDFTQMPTIEDTQRMQAITTDRELDEAEQASLRRIVLGRAVQLAILSAQDMANPDGIID